MTIWDTAGQERFQFVSKMYYKMAQGFTLVYDITNRDSFENLKYWVNEIEQKANNWKIILLGNKWDLESKRKITYEEGAKFAEEHNFEFLETSAKNNININEAYESIVLNIIEDLDQPEKSIWSYSLRDLSNNDESEGSWDKGC